MMQKPVKANISRFTPTSPVSRSHHGLTSQASSVPASVKLPATSQIIRSRYQESVRAQYMAWTSAPPSAILIRAHGGVKRRSIRSLSAA